MFRFWLPIPCNAVDQPTVEIPVLHYGNSRLAELEQVRPHRATWALDGGQSIHLPHDSWHGLNTSADSYADRSIRFLRISDLSSDGSYEAAGVFLDDPVDARFLVETGDLLLSRSGTIGQSFLVPEALAGSASAGFLIRFRPDKRVADSRFLGYVARSSVFQAAVEIDAVSSTIQNFNADKYGNIRVPLPPLEEQRRIAAFLDAQVRIIDVVRVARLRQSTLLQEEYEGQLDNLVKSRVSRALHTLTDPRRPIQYGIVLPGPDFPGGVPIVKGGDVGSGRMASGVLNRTDPEIEARYARSRLVGGDLVVSIRGSIGEVAVVPESLTGANLTQDAARVAVRPAVADPQWLYFTLSAPSVQSEMRSRVTGAMVPGLNIEALRAVKVPDVPLAGQRKAARAIVPLVDSVGRQRAALSRSLELLDECKRSLITSAVKGDFDVSAASGRGVSA